MAARVRSKFDAEAVRKAARKGSEDALKSVGAYARKTAQRMVRKSSKPSAKGSPPHTRRGRLKKSILYGVEKERQAVVIGPAANLISQTQYYHEFGKTQSIRTKRRKYKIGSVGPVRTGPVFGKLRNREQVKRATELDKKLWPNAGGRKRRKYPKRPLMGPTLEKIMPVMSKFWADSVKK